MQFLEYVDYRNRELRLHLRIIAGILKLGGLQVYVRTKVRFDPYLFVFDPNGGPNGARIYNVGGGFAIRSQKRERTEPFGRSAELRIEEDWTSILDDSKNDDEAAETLSKDLIEQVQEFFKEQKKAEKKLQSLSMDDGPFGTVSVQPEVPDYANSVKSGQY